MDASPNGLYCGGHLRDTEKMNMAQDCCSVVPEGGRTSCAVCMVRENGDE